MFREQIRRNAVALISLVVALSTLLYTTWRNEETEDNWNTRVAGFEMLTTLGELQRIVYLNHYDGDLDEGNPRKGWVRVMVLRDLGGRVGEQGREGDHVDVGQRIADGQQITVDGNNGTVTIHV